MTRTLRNLWPELRDTESAEKAARQVFFVAALVAALDALFGLLALAGAKVEPYDASILFDGALFAIIAWRTYRPSKAWSVLGLCLIIFVVGDTLVEHPTTISAVSALLVLGSINGVRGAFAYNRLTNAEASVFCFCGKVGKASHAFCGN